MSSFTVVVKNLPPAFDQIELERLFSQCGSVVSTKILPPNPAYEGLYGFVNYDNAESCQSAIQKLNGYSISNFILTVSRAQPQMQNRTPRSNSTPEAKPVVGNQMNSSRSVTSPIRSDDSQRFSAVDEIVPLRIREHDLLKENQTMEVYLLHYESPSLIFVATLDDYIRLKMLEMKMSDREKLGQTKANSYRDAFVSKFSFIQKISEGQLLITFIDQVWHRSRVLQTKESRVLLELIDWGSTHWVDPVLETRPLSIEYTAEPIFSIKCALDGIDVDARLSNDQKSSVEQMFSHRGIKMNMKIVRVQNSIHFVQLTFDGRDVNEQVKSIVSSVAQVKSLSITNFDDQKPNVDLKEIHQVKITSVHRDSSTISALLLRDHFVSIFNVLKNWDNKNQAMNAPIKSGTLVCAQSKSDDLWYRAWIDSVRNEMYRVYFVDFGFEESLPIQRLSECPEALKTIPWQNIQIRLNEMTLSEQECDWLVETFQYEILDMEILKKEQDIYYVNLSRNKQPLANSIVEYRKSVKVETNPTIPPIAASPVIQKPAVIQPVQGPWSPVQASPSPVQIRPSLISTRLTPLVTPVPSENTTTPAPTNNQTPKENISETLLNNFIQEQKRQSRLLEQMIAAINTTNALLTQLVQR